MTAIKRTMLAAALSLTVLPFPSARAGVSAPSSAYFTLAPCRLLDTRDSAPIDHDDQLVVPVAGQCGLPPTGVLSATVNVTVLGATAAGSVFVSDTCCSEAVVYFAAGQTRANNAVILIGGTGNITVAADLPDGNSVHVLVDVTGYFLPNDPPEAVDDDATVDEDASATAIPVLANDTDPDGPSMVVKSATQPANGAVVLTGGSPGQHTGLTYQPDPDYCNAPPGTTLDTFTYTLAPGGSTATVTMTVTCVDDDPTAVDDSATVAEDAAATTIDVLANDTDPDGGPKLVTAVDNPSSQGGTVLITNAGADLSYEPAAGYCNNPPGTTLDTFTYTITGGDSATVTVTVTCDDDDPTAVNDSATVAEDAPATTIDVLANDTDPDGGTKTIASATAPANGTVVVAGDNLSLTYQPDANYCNSVSGPLDTFDYTLSPGGSSATVSVTVTCVDDAPVAVADSATVAEDDPATTIDVQANDTDLDGGPKTIASATDPANGTVVVAGDNLSLTYQPDANYCNSVSGPLDTFDYTLNGGSSTTVSVTVTCVDDNPVAVADSATVTEDDPATTINVLANDTDLDGGPKTIASATDPANGTVVVAGDNLSLTYQPDANYCNTAGPLDTFDYTLSPGGSSTTVSVTVTCVDDAPVAVADSATVTEDAPAATINVLANDTDIDGGPKTIASATDPANGTVVVAGDNLSLAYQPDPNTCNSVSGPLDTFDYTLNGGSSTTVSVSVTCVDDNPVAVADSATVAEDDPATTVNVLANDTDIDGGPKTIASATDPANGTVVIAGDSLSLTYQPDANYCNTAGPLDTFNYTLSPGGSSTTVSMTVTCVNDAPVAVDEAFQAIGNTELRVDLPAGSTPHASETTAGASSYEGVLDNDGDPEGDTVSVTAVGSGCGDASAPFDCTLADGAVVHVDANGEFSYTPGPGDTAGGFEYTITDQPAFGSALSDTGNVTFAVVEMVWYVDNSGAAGTGTSLEPFNALTCAAGNIADGGNDPACTVDGDLGDDADGPNHYIFIDFGDGTATGLDQGFALENGQHLIGEFAGLSLPVSLNGNGAPTVLQAPPGLTDCAGGPCRPLLDDVLPGGPSGVTATDVIPLELVGLNLAGNDNAIEWTTGVAFAGAGVFTVRDNVVRAAANQGIQVDLTGTGAVGLAVHDNTLTATGTALDVFEHGAGTLSIRAFHDNVVAGTSGAAGIDIFGVEFDAAPAPGIQPVPGGTTSIGDAGDRIGGAGLTLWVVRGALDFANVAVPASGIGAGDLDVFTDSGAALDVIGAGGFDLDVTDNAGVLVANDGPAASIINSDVELELAALTSSGGAAGVSLSGVTGTFAAAAGAITKASGGGTAFAVGTSSATVNYGGTLNVSAGAGVALTNNTGAVNFTGVLTLATGADPAFSAIGSSGTVTATNAGNTIATTTGAALSVNGPDLGPGGLVFQSVSANGAGTGILLQDTGSAGGLTVSGVGSTDGSGGTIQNITSRGASFINAAGIALSNMNFTNVGTVNGADPTNPGSSCGDLGAGGGGNNGCNAGIHAQGVSGLSLTNVDLNGGAQQGINGSELTNFTLAGSVVQNFGNQTGEDGLHVRNLLGTAAITNSTFTGNERNQVRIQNGAGTLTDLAVTGSVFENPGIAAGLAENGILFAGHTLAAMKVSIAGCTFQDLPAAGFRSDAADSAAMEVTITGSSFQDLGSSAIVIAKGAAANVKYEVSGNPTFLGAGSHVIDIDQQPSSTSGSVLQGLLDDNVIGDAGMNSAVDPALCAACDGIRVRARGAGATIANITNNSVRGTTARGISAELSASASAANRLDATITGNTVELTDAVRNDHAVLVQAGLDATGDDGVACADIADNTASSSAVADDGIHVRQRERVELRMPGYTGGLTANAAVIAYLQARNPLTVDTIGATAIPVGDPTAGFLNTPGPGNPCAQPVLPP